MAYKAEEMSCDNCKYLDECDIEYMYMQGCWCENYLPDDIYLQRLEAKKALFADNAAGYFKKFQL